MLELNKIYLGDCLDFMKDIPDKSIDAIITDPPYGTTACKWDSVIPFEPMWKQLNRIIKPNGAIVLFGSEPFSSALRMSNIKNYKYDWVWDKVRAVGAHTSKIRPLQKTENISVFGQSKINYIRQMTKRNKIRIGGKEYGRTAIIGGKTTGKNDGSTIYTHYHPTNILIVSNASNKDRLHPTQKPEKLIEYLIKTYTLENETVLDFTIGSGTTAVACINTGRNFIGIEKEKKYYDIAVKRIQDAGGNVIQQPLCAIVSEE